jgi:hypothetical protein
VLKVCKFQIRPIHPPLVDFQLVKFLRTFRRGRPQTVAPHSINLLFCNKFRLRYERRPLAEGPKKHLPFSRIANRSKSWDPPTSGALSIYRGLHYEYFSCHLAFCVVIAVLALAFCECNCSFLASAFVVTTIEMAEDKKTMDSALAGFYEAMERTNIKKITDEMLDGLSGDSSDSDSFDVESGNEDAEDRPWRPSHVIFGKSSVKQGQIEVMKGKYFHDISIVRARGENTVPLPEANEVVVFKSFMKAGLCFPLHKMLVEVLKTFEIYLHQLTPEALIKVGVFIWAMRSQGLEPDAKCFCNIHELSYRTKATRKEQYHNNFECYSFVPHSDARFPVPTF